MCECVKDSIIDTCMHACMHACVFTHAHTFTYIPYIQNTTAHTHAYTNMCIYRYVSEYEYSKYAVLFPP